jgi:two-component system phosphate regulon sensor histidine kinase PhoR
MERSTARLSGLVESLLDFARMESGRKAFLLEPIDASELVTAVVDEFRRQLNAPDVSVMLTTAGRLPVAGDRTALAQAVWNLLDNAVKYSTAPAIVRVSVDRVGDTVVVAVHDDGPGIPRHEQRDIFGKFVRGAHAARSEIKGTGLGLAIVRHVVRAHHGTVRVDSEIGRGSTFTLTLPGLMTT